MAFGETRWSNVAGRITFDLEYDAEKRQWFDISREKLPPLEMVPRYDDGTAVPQQHGQEMDVVVDFLSSGYDLPMSMYGGRDHVGWPAEHEDERIVQCISMTMGAVTVRIKGKKACQAVFDAYEDEIMAADLEMPTRWED